MDGCAVGGHRALGFSQEYTSAAAILEEELHARRLGGKGSRSRLQGLQIRVFRFDSGRGLQLYHVEIITLNLVSAWALFGVLPRPCCTQIRPISGHSVLLPAGPRGMKCGTMIDAIHMNPCSRNPPA
jgi:hypothetical protein